MRTDGMGWTRRTRLLSSLLHFTLATNNLFRKVAHLIVLECDGFHFEGPWFFRIP